MAASIISSSDSVGRSVVSDSAAPWTVPQQAPLSVGLSRPGCRTGEPFPPPPGDLPNPGILPGSPALQILYHLSCRGSPKSRTRTQTLNGVWFVSLVGDQQWIQSRPFNFGDTLQWLRALPCLHWGGETRRRARRSQETPAGPDAAFSSSSHLAAVAHRTLHVRSSPPEVAGVRRVALPVVSASSACCHSVSLLNVPRAASRCQCGSVLRHAGRHCN